MPWGMKPFRRVITLPEVSSSYGPASEPRSLVGRPMMYWVVDDVVAITELIGR